MKETMKHTSPKIEARGGDSILKFQHHWMLSDGSWPSYIGEESERGLMILGRKKLIILKY